MPFSTLHFREDPDYWAKWFPADFITESFPGQFRNWFYSMLAMSTVLRREPPFKTIFGYALVFGEDGRPMHKSWGNAIEFDEAAERMGVDVMRWMFATARPEDNILLRLARRRRGAPRAARPLERLRVLRRPTPGSPAGRRTGDRAPPAPDAARRWTAGSCRARPALAADVGARLADYDALGATRDDRRRSSTTSRPGTCACRATRFSRNDDAADRDAAFATLHAALVALARVVAPILPFLTEAMYQNLVVAVVADAPDRVHLTRWPADELAPLRDERSRRRWRRPGGPSSWPGRCAAQAGLRIRQPLARLWLALPGGDLRARRAARADRATRSTSRRSS